MRQSFLEFILKCCEVRLFLSVTHYELYSYEDGAYADFRVQKINDAKALAQKIGRLDYMIFADGGCVIVRVFEDFNE